MKTTHLRMPDGSSLTSSLKRRKSEMGFYPKLRALEPCQEGGCECCGVKAAVTVVVAFLCLSSKDERYRACQAHLRMAQHDIDEFMAATEAWGIANAR